MTLDAKHCLEFLKNPFKNPLTGGSLNPESWEQSQVRLKCNCFINFDLLKQTRIDKFKYPKDSPVLSFLTAVYLMNRSKQICQPFMPEFESDGIDGIDGFLSNFDFGIIYNNNQIIMPRQFVLRVNSCTKRFSLILLTIISHKHKLTTANLLLYDKVKQEWERYVPFGASQIPMQLSHNIDHQLIKVLDKTKLKPIKYYQPYVGCPGYIYRNAGDVGDIRNVYCAVWGLWFFEMKLLYPDLWREQRDVKAKFRLATQTNEFNNYVEDYLKFLLNARIKMSEQLDDLLKHPDSMSGTIDDYLAKWVFSLLK